MECQFQHSGLFPWLLGMQIMRTQVLADQHIWGVCVCERQCVCVCVCVCVYFSSTYYPHILRDRVFGYPAQSHIDSKWQS